MKTTVEKPDTVRRGTRLIVASVSVLMILAFSLFVYFVPASADSAFATPLCGNGSAPDYGFSYDLQQAHWTVDWQNYVSEATVNEVDTILDRLNADSIVQTMILIKPQEQVGNRVNCAVHFLRYMKLVLPEGERKDNGFAFLIVVLPDSIDVHYGVGLGLPALTASELTDLNRSAEDTYQSTKSMDQALLALVKGFDGVARSNYTPLISATQVSDTGNQAQTPAGPLGILTICGQLCFGIFLLLFLMWMFSQMARRGVTFGSSGFGSGGAGFPLGGGRSRGGMGGGGGISRGGSGSGRSGRGN